MHKSSPSFSLFPLLFLFSLLAGVASDTSAEPRIAPPWRAAGLSEREAAAHLLDRFAYGARPGEIDRIVAMGLDTWLAHQLAADLPEPALERRLAGLPTLELTARQITETFPNPGLVLLQARRDGIIGEDVIPARPGEGDGDGASPERREARRKVFEYARSKGYRSQRELLGELMAQKLYRALYAESQLREVLTDFWLNHFNVSITDNEARALVLPYERDAIRPQVLGSFRTMLEATAKHPAMLAYLDNAQSVAAEGVPTTLDRRRERFRGPRGGRDGRGGRGGRGDLDEPTRRFLEDRRPQGLNENYARELLELHTLGVDGGYSQADVVAVARAFTGWASYPPGELRERLDERMRLAKRFDVGFVFEEDFLFRADAHDAGEKLVLGHRLPAGRGIEDGRDVLDLLVRHPATARHLATKLAVRFVSDEPPATLVDRLAASFAASRGDLRQVMAALVDSPEFWSPAARAQKIKSPFELTVSALRALGADVIEPRATVEWVARMGQPLYAYQAPTGYPDRADFWVNAGALLNRMNFGLELAAGRVGGVRFDLAGLDAHREPESLEAALATYVPLLLPERDPTETLDRLGPVVRDPELASKIEKALPAASGPSAAERELELMDFFALGTEGRVSTPRMEPPPAQLAHVVGVILGSPEFQRR